MYKIKPLENVIRSIKILIIDDDSSFLDTTKVLLERLGHNVTFANGSRETVALMKEYYDVFNDVFDLIITEYSMPYMNGVEFAKIANGLLMDTPIILYTGKVDLIDKTQIYEAGIAAVISKTCKVSKLDQIIKSVVSAKS